MKRPLLITIALLSSLPFGGVGAQEAQGSLCGKPGQPVCSSKSNHEQNIQSLEHTLGRLLGEPKHSPTVNAPEEPTPPKKSVPPQNTEREAHGLVIDGVSSEIKPEPLDSTPTIVIIGKDIPKDPPKESLPGGERLPTARQSNPSDHRTPPASTPIPIERSTRHIPSSRPLVEAPPPVLNRSATSSTRGIPVAPRPVAARAPTPTRTGRNVYFFKTCDEAWLARKAPLSRDEDGYRLELDPDGDGVACESIAPLMD